MSSVDKGSAVPGTCNSYSTREEWLQAAVTLLKEQLFDPRELWLPPILRVSVGLCPGKAVGICVDPDCSEDGSTNLFIDPQLTDLIQVLSTLLHEMVHACVGNECKHKGKFVEVIRELGLEGKPTATYASQGTELYATLEGMVVTLGAYPHAALVRKKKKDTKPHAWVSFISTSNEDFICRVNINTVKELGPPRDYNGEPMVPKDDETARRMEEDSEEKEEGDE